MGLKKYLKIMSNKTTMKKIEKLSFSDLKALESHCISKMNYYIRRIPPIGTHKNIYKEIYPLWVYWFNLHIIIQEMIKEYIDNLTN